MPVFIVTRILYQNKSELSHVSIKVTRSFAATGILCLVPIKLAQPSYGLVELVKEFPITVRVYIAPPVVRPSYISVTCELEKVSGI